MLYIKARILQMHVDLKGGHNLSINLHTKASKVEKIAPRSNGDA